MLEPTVSNENTPTLGFPQFPFAFCVLNAKCVCVCVWVWVEGGRVWSGHAVMQCSVVGRFLCAGVEQRGRYGSESVGYGGSGSNLVQMVYLSTNLNLECTHARRHTLKQRNLINYNNVSDRRVERDTAWPDSSDVRDRFAIETTETHHGMSCH